MQAFCPFILKSGLYEEKACIIAGIYYRGADDWANSCIIAGFGGDRGFDSKRANPLCHSNETS
ncbi:hypothetical protein GCM10010913_22200 [Paenibacillus aceti]|uniref:Uncharacterized protein n=1 Tax=Paenibacillus aceti TaxID=1820010 RepID=A0ABQ1VV62_9BACL|nr:hypothetical protein GCM10010913_22200 [Paenibacillus aceti]